MNLPNKLTLLRIILIPVFVFFALLNFPGHSIFALVVFIVASLTDMLDGKIARKRHLVTNFGKFMDPLADKILVITALLCIIVMDEGTRMCSGRVLYFIAVLIIVFREFIISGFRTVAADEGIVIAASMWGKVKTAVTMVAICLMLVYNEIPALHEITMVVFWIAVTLTVVSLVDYLMKNKPILETIGFIGGKKKRKKKKNSSFDIIKYFETRMAQFKERRGQEEEEEAEEEAPAEETPAAEEAPAVEEAPAAEAPAAEAPVEEAPKSAKKKKAAELLNNN